MKKVWEMTHSEFYADQAVKYKGPYWYTNTSTFTRAVSAAHRIEVEKAVKEGKPVPYRVLLEYYRVESWADEAIRKLEKEKQK